jgi:hypothetical protein
MKHLLVLIFMLVGLNGFSQIKFKFPDTRVLTDINGGVIDRGDQFDVMVHANGNSDAVTRQLLFDFQYDQTNFEIISINHTGTGGNGGILPSGANIQLSWQNYPGYGFTGTSNSNGTQTYLQTTSYSYNANGSNAIIRATLTWAIMGTGAMPFNSFSQMLVVRFRLKAASTANSFNPVKLNFVAGWNGAGVGVPTIMDTPLSTEVVMNQNTGKFVTAKVDINSNLLALTDVKISFRDTLTNTGQLFSVLSNGNVDINQSLLAENKVYEVSVMHSMDNTYAVYNGAITISDFTTAQGEFTSMGLDGSNGQILRTGQSLYAADINRNRVIDGGDLPRLLGQVVGIDTLITLPAGYTPNSGNWRGLPTWRTTDAISIAGQTEWCVINVNGYGQGQTRVYIDIREFNGTNILPESIKSLQLFDLYSGPVEFMSKDGSWAFYKVPSTFTTLSTSTFTPYIRSMGNNDYGIKAEFTFNPNPNNSWGSVTTTNWKDITYPKTYFKTGVLGTNEILELKYLLWGDVNRSHSSQVVVINNGSTTIQTNAANSLQTNTAFITTAANTGFINTSTGEVNSIDVHLSNITVTSNNIEIPVNIDTKGNNVGGLQFQFAYDPNKIKFEELANNIPNTWYTFVNSKTGVVKFGSLDQVNKTPITGTSTPFKLKFSTIGNGVDILTSVKVSPIMDASSSDGTQLGINLNTTTIKLTGYNNF